MLGITNMDFRASGKVKHKETIWGAETAGIEQEILGS